MPNQDRGLGGFFGILRFRSLKERGIAALKRGLSAWQ